ncbi:hypothetical protein DRN63_02675 [Nanoarchaeota archaeon]|nr:MAG: hypothetical protein DRN63_02675 [Nanoarchaeota archaeon]
MKLRIGYEAIQNWDMEVSEKEPEILCISGPYLDQLLFREVRNRSANELINFKVIGSWSDHHHGHSTVYRSGIKLKDVLNMVEDLKEDYKFALQKGLRIRKEKNGMVIAQGRNAYFVNDIGSKLLEELKNNTVTVRDVRRICKKLSVAEQKGLEFFKKLIIFEVLEWIP